LKVNNSEENPLTVRFLSLCNGVLLPMMSLTSSELSDDMTDGRTEAPNKMIMKIQLGATTPFM
jgi:hypothetical protein